MLIGALIKGKKAIDHAEKTAKKKIKISAKTGKVSIRKGLKKGTYKVKVQIKAAESTNYKALTKTVTFKVRVK